MAILNILHYPDERLHKIAAPVEDVDKTLQQLVHDMAETMYAAPGIGLAATQVNVHKQVIVIDISETKDDLMVFINPTLVNLSGTSRMEEGCLSLPGVFEEVERAEKITVKALDLAGNSFKLEAEGLLATCIQHEIDHLKGRVFIQHLSRLKQERIVTKLKKMQRATM